MKNAAQNIFKEVCTFSWTLTSLDALQISFVSTNTFSLVFSLLCRTTCPPSKVFFVLYVVWFLCLIQPCTRKNFKFVKNHGTSSVSLKRAKHD